MRRQPCPREFFVKKSGAKIPAKAKGSGGEKGSPAAWQHFEKSERCAGNAFLYSPFCRYATSSPDRGKSLLAGSGRRNPIQNKKDSYQKLSFCGADKRT
jgi:hypothetical protein